MGRRYYVQGLEVYFGTPGDPTSLLICVATSEAHAAQIAGAMNLEFT